MSFIVQPRTFKLENIEAIGCEPTQLFVFAEENWRLNLLFFPLKGLTE